MTTPPTPADLEAADVILSWFVTDPPPSRETIASIIAAHRAAADTSDYDNVLRQRGLRAAFDQAVDDARKLRAAPTDPVQAHAAELENLLAFFRPLIFEFRRSRKSRWSSTAERKYDALSALLVKLDAERKAVTK